MTRLLTLAALGLAIALAPTPGEAQQRSVPDYFHLLDQNQDDDNFLTRSDFDSQPDNARRTRACIDQIRSSPTYSDLPREDKTRLDRLYNIAGGGRGRVRADADEARNEFIRQHPNRVLVPDGC